MRIVHTSDWHAGRSWKSVDRLPELEAVLDHLATYCAEQRVDLLLITGDLFDTGAPSAKAERVVFRFLKRVGAAGTRSVVIAGNHDNPQRIEAWGTLAELVGVHALGLPKAADRGGIVEIPSRDGTETAIVACVPFAPVGRLVDATQGAFDATAAAQSYADGFSGIVDALRLSFRSDAVNLIAAHTHLEGALIGGSERRVHIGNEWAATAQSFPANVHYVALGHIHKPQAVPSPVPTLYAGSPLQLDFGEIGEEKSFVVIEASAGAPARVSRVPYVGGKPLAEIRGTISEIEAAAPNLRDAWLRVTVLLDGPDPEVNRRVRRLLPNAVSVDAVVPTLVHTAPARASLKDTAPADLYRAFIAHRGAPPLGLIERFEALRAELEENN